MSDYARILAKINETNWLITQGGLDTILQIVEDRIILGRMSEEDILLKLEESGTNDKRDRQIFRSVDGVAILPVMGPIFGKGNMLTMMSGASSLQQMQQQLRAAVADEDIHSIIMEYDTPGGSSDLVEEFGSEIAASKMQKPIYASVNTMCGSAGLWLASQSSKVYITPSGSMGSLGVYTAHTDRSGANLKNGIQRTFISAGRYKTEGNPDEPLSSEAIQHRQEVVNGLMDKFVGAVATGRGKDADYVRHNFGEGRMFESQQAVDVGMADGVMSYDDLLTGLVESQPKQVQIQMPGAVFANATLFGNQVRFDSADKETVLMISEAIRQMNIDVPSTREEDSDMPELSAEALTALGLSADATDEQISAAVVAMNSQLTPLQDLRNSIDAAKTFAEQFPEQAAKMAKLEEKNRTMEAEAFSKSYRDVRFGDIKIEKVDGEDKEVITKTTKGLSGLALQKIEEVFLQSATSEGIQLSDVKSMLDAVMTGVVDYGEVGTQVGAEPEEQPQLNGNILEIRQVFANKVYDVMKADEVDEDTAIKLVAEKHPELWERYKNPAIGAGR